MKPTRPPITITVKCWPQWFAGVIHRSKTFEIRLNDRDYRTGDTLRLQEYDPLTKTLSGRVALCKVLDVLSDFKGLAAGYVAMGIFFDHLETKNTKPKDEEEWP